MTGFSMGHCLRPPCEAQQLYPAELVMTLQVELSLQTMTSTVQLDVRKEQL